MSAVTVLQAGQRCTIGGVAFLSGSDHPIFLTEEDRGDVTTVHARRGP